MNEQGKELIENLRWEARAQKVGASRISYSITPEELEKFAELIIQECIDVGIQSGILDNDWNYPLYKKRIKEHFGVE